MWRRLSILAIVLLCCASVYAQNTVGDSISVSEHNQGIGVIFPNARRDNFSGKHVAWGLEVGSSVDLTGNDLSTFDAHLFGGYSNRLFQVLGVGLGIHRSIGRRYNKNLFIPIYGVVRTSFRTKPSRFFFTLKSGYSFNTVHNGASKGGFLISGSGGFVLTRSRILTSYISLGYGYYHINDATVYSQNLDLNHIDFAHIFFGVLF